MKIIFSAEILNLLESEKKKIESLEMWCMKRMLRISWNKFGINRSILEEHGVKQRLSSVVQTRFITFFRHVSRRDNSHSIEWLVVQGKIEGTREHGESLMWWSNQDKGVLNAPLHQCANKATVKDEWRYIVKRICRHILYSHIDDHDCSGKSVTTKKKMWKYKLSFFDSFSQLKHIFVMLTRF